MKYEKAEYGCIHGRFQPFDKGHFEYMCGALNLCRNLVIGITQYESKIEDAASPGHRLQMESNPFSYWERRSIILSIIEANSISRSRISIVPFPIQTPKLIHNYVPENTIMYTTIYEKWNIEKIRRLREHFKVVSLWRRKVKQFEGGTVRKALFDDPMRAIEMLPDGAKAAIDKIGRQ